MKKLKKILIPLACKVLLSPKSFAEAPKRIRRISCREQDVTLLANTSNNVLRVKSEGSTFYLRECKRHLPLLEYVLASVENYYSYVGGDPFGDKAFLESCLRDKKRLKLFSDMGMTNDLNSGAYRFCMGQGPQWIGLPAMDSEREERLKDLVQFIWGDLFSYSLNGGIKKGHYQTYHAVRSIATYRMAELLGLSGMVPKTEFVLLHQNGREPILCTLMESAPGICMESISCEERQAVSSPDLQKALNRLNLLDVINLEKDHRTGNYHVVLRNGKAETVVAFDNDSPNSFGIGGISFRTYMGCSPWSVSGRVNRPYIDKDLADKILSLDFNEVRHQLKEILNSVQIRALLKRVKQVQQVLRATPASAFLCNEEWSEETMRQELSGEFGMTYLQQFLGEQKLLEQPWIKER